MSRTSARPFRLVPVLVAVSALVLTLVVPAQGAAVPVERGVTAAAAKKVSPQVKYLRQAQRATNAARKRNGVATVKGDQCLRRWARKHANRLAKAGGGIWHQDLGPVLRKCNLGSVGENVAMGYPTGRAVVNQGWLKSPGHRANILNSQFRLSVVVARRDKAGRWYAVQLFGHR